MSTISGDLPADTSIIIPRLVCRDPASEIDFCVDAFEAVEHNRRPGPDGSLAHAMLKIGAEMIMIEAEWPTLPSRAPATDGTSPLLNQFWGDRIAWLLDPSGHVWTVATRIEETTAQERTDRWDKILATKQAE